MRSYETARHGSRHDRGSQVRRRLGPLDQRRGQWRRHSVGLGSTQIAAIGQVGAVPPSRLGPARPEQTRRDLNVVIGQVGNGAAEITAKGRTASAALSEMAGAIASASAASVEVGGVAAEAAAAAERGRPRLLRRSRRWNASRPP